MDAQFTTGLALVAVIFAWLANRRTKRLDQRIVTLEALLRDDDLRSRTEDAPEDPAIPAPPEPVKEEPRSTSGWGGAMRRPNIGLGGLGTWMRANWIYPVSGAALVMAAVFLVQYWIERGVLTPEVRILLGLGLGLALIGGGEFLRRRWADSDSGARAAAATLAGAGIGALFAAVLAAFHIYAMLGQGATLAALAAVALLALVLGWVRGPLLAAIGVLAGAAAPFVLGPSDQPTDLLYGYFGLVAVLGMAIDGLRRWGWVAPLAVLVALAGVTLNRLSGADFTGAALAFMVIPLMSMALPSGALVPHNAGPMLAARRRPQAATLTAALALVLGAAGLVLLFDPGLGALCLAVLALAHPLWTRDAPALANQVLIPVVALPLALAADAGLRPLTIASGLFASDGFPILVVLITALAGVAMLWRGERDTGAFRPLWALVGIGFPGATLVAFELFWQVGTRANAYAWALSAMALAGGYTAVALWAARRDAGQGMRLGAAAAAALAMIAMAMTVTLSLTALTVALAVLMIAAAAMDRRFDIPLVAWFVVLGAMTMGWRLVVSPGMGWLVGFDETAAASALEVAISLLAMIGAPVIALIILRPLPNDPLRAWARVVVETALSGSVPIALTVALVRFLPEFNSPYVHGGIQVTVLAALALTQALRARQIGGSLWMRRVRLGLALLLAATATLIALLVLTVLSPLSAGILRPVPVEGWPLINDLLLGYAVPGLMLLWCAHRCAPGLLQRLLRGAGGLFLALWGFMAIRHLWRGGDAMALSSGFDQGELYAYTVALLVAGAAALALALRHQRTAFRLLGLGLIALAAAKAFLVDASGLSGLLRVGGFLALGLSLAGLAWLNGWVARRIEDPGTNPPDEGS